MRMQWRLALVLSALIVACAASLGLTTQQSTRVGLLNAGESVPPLKGFGLDGMPVVIDFRQSAKPTVVYVVDEYESAFVKRNEANFAALVKQAASRFMFVIVCPVDTGHLSAWVERTRPAWGGVPVAVVANVPTDLRDQWALFAYPQTLVISRESKVVENFKGAYTSSSQNAQPSVI